MATANNTARTPRRIDKYDGQTIFINNEVAYELGNYLGGGASGSVYQAVETQASNILSEKFVAIKILNPLGYKLIPVSQIQKCTVTLKGTSLAQDQCLGNRPMSTENIWWLLHPPSKQFIAAYEVITFNNALSRFEVLLAFYVYNF